MKKSYGPLLLMLALFAGCDENSTPAEPVDAGIMPDVSCPDCPAECPEPENLPNGFTCIEAGEFWMGSPPSETQRIDFEEDRHKVSISAPFLMATHEVSQAEWSALVGNNPSYFQEGVGGCEVDACDTRPVERINWHEAVAFANRRSESEGLQPCYELAECDGELGAGCEGDSKTCLAGFICGEVTRLERCTGYRLPTEAEWEYAVRAGEEGMRYGSIDDIAWYVATARLRTHPVGELAPNANGLYDPFGNVSEWTGDFFNQDYGFFGDPEDAVTDPLGGEFGMTRVYKGCNLTSGVEICRAAQRGKDFPARRAHGLGFRLVKQIK